MSDEQDAPEAHAAFTGAPAADADSVVKVPAAEWNRLRGLEDRLAELEAKYNADLAAKGDELTAAQAKAQELETTIGGKDAALAEAQAKTGDVDRLLADQRAELERAAAEASAAATAAVETIRKRHHASEMAAVVSQSLAGVVWCGATPQDNQKIAQRAAREISELLETAEDAQGNVIVREKGTGRPAHEVAASWLRAGENQMFLAARTTGGSGTDATRQAPLAQSEHPVGSPQWAVERWRRGQAEANATKALQVRPRGY